MRSIEGVFIYEGEIHLLSFFVDRRIMKDVSLLFLIGHIVERHTQELLVSSSKSSTNASL